MKLIADLHTHTVACGHAFSTVEENVRAAKRAEILVLAITEHGPSLPGGPHHYLLGAMSTIPPYIEGIRILRGAELNIISSRGKLDLDQERISRLDLLLAGFHAGTPYQGKSRDENTQALCNVMENPYLDIIAHPDNPAYPLDYKEVVRKAVAEEILLEINVSSLKTSHPGRENGRKNCLEFLALGKKEGLHIAVGSDAHISYAVGQFQAATRLLDETDYPPELILNYSQEGLEEFLEKRPERINKKLKSGSLKKRKGRR